MNEALRNALDDLASLPITERVEVINEIRRTLKHISPFTDEPVDCIQWVPENLVIANDYNPNAVAPPEMELLHTSIQEDGYTQPIVVFQHDGIYEVVDGFHRNRADSASGKADELAEMVDECSTSLESLGGWKSALLDMHYLSGKTLVEIGKMDAWKHKRQYMSVLHLQALDEFYDHMPHYRRDPIYPAI